MGVYYPNRPTRCPNGHELGPGTYHLSYRSDAKDQVLYCNQCRSRILLVAGAEWEVLVGDRWRPYEG